MSQILSQNEVDALLKGITNGDIETAHDEETGIVDARIYDLTSQDRIVRGRMPTLEMLNEKFVRMFRRTLSSMLRKVVTINTSSVKMIKYGEFLRTIPLPTSLHLFKMEPLRGNALFIFESRFIFTLVDILFGGTGRHIYKVEGRDFTPIETNLIKMVVKGALADLEKAWETIINLDISYQNSEVNPQFAQIVSPTDVVVIVDFEVEMDFSSGSIKLCIPYSMLEPVKEKLQSGFQSDKIEINAEWADKFKEELKMSTINMIVELGQTELSGKEIINLKKGDVVVLDRFLGDTLDVYVEGLLKFKGEPGLYKGNQAVRIARIVSEEEVKLYGAE